MPDEEPRVESSDAAPGTASQPSDTEQHTLFSASDAATTEASVGVEQASGGALDEWDTPAAEADVEPASGDDERFATGVLEIVSSLDDDAAAPGDSPEAGGPLTELAAQVPETAELPVVTAEPSAGPAPEDAVVPSETTAVAPTPADALPGAGDEGIARDAAEAADATPVATAVSDEPADATAESPQDLAEGVVAAPGAASAPDAATVAAPATPPALAAVPAVKADEPRVPWWPFVVYLGVWVVALGDATYLLLQVPDNRPLFEQQLYGYVVLGGLVLTLLGPVLIPFVWLLARSGVEKERRGGLFARTAFWGALATLAGVILWWGTLIVLDSVRLGRPL